MTSPDSVQGVCHDLFEFVHEQPLPEYNRSSFVASFRDPQPRDEIHFEQLLWSLLQSMHDQDSLHHNWDPETSSDPENSQFSFSFAGRSYFVVGLHHASSRYSRRFTYPTVVFNAHYQFEQLKKDGEFENFQKIIRANDMRLQHSINPSLTSYGDDSEAKQYSGRLVERTWKCPFQGKEKK